MDCTNMAHRKSLIQVKLQLRQDILRKLERDAKRRNISTTDEIARRIDESFKYGDWRDERERLIAAAFADLRPYPNPAATKAAIGKIEESSERDIQNELMDLFRAKPLDQSGESAKPVVSAPSPDELVTQSREAKRQRHEKRIDAITRRRRGR
jgi:hypothetical protein